MDAEQGRTIKLPSTKPAAAAERRVREGSAVVPNEQKERARRKAAGESRMPDPGNKRLLADTEHESRVQDLMRRIEVQREADRRIAEQNARSAFTGFASVSLREAIARPREVKPAIIDGLQMQGHKATLTAQYKAGKTTFSSNVVRSLADRIPLLDRFEVVELPGNIGIFDYELTQDDALDLYQTLGIENTDRIFLEPLRGEGFSFANEFHRDIAIKWLREHDVAYWLLDPFGRAMRGFGSENDNDDVRQFLDAIDLIISETSVIGTLMPVHTGRVQHEVGAEHGRGATVVDDDADARWILTKDPSGRRFFRAEGRAGVGLEEISLEFDPPTSQLTVGATTRRQSAEEVRVERVLPKLEAYLAQRPGQGTNDIRKDIPGKNTDIDSALALGITKGTIRVEKQGVKKAHFYVPQKTIKITSEEADE